ncbi:MAG: primase [Micromonosporaceae bacterium]|nr:primase [Micromonosporaceae bacterium]
MTTPTLGPDNPIGVDPTRLVAAHRDARGFYRHQLVNADGPRRYLTDRGLGPLTRPDLPWAPGVDSPWHLGYALPGWTNLVDHLTALGYTPSEQIAAGLATRTRTGGLIDKFRDRIMFPIHHHDGAPVAFIGRAAPTATDVPKYLNTADTVIYHKGQILYGLGEQRDRAQTGWAPVIVEGPIDVLAIWLAHPQHAGIGRIGVAACGTSLTEHQTATICALPGATRRGVTTAFDEDPAGRKATERAWQLLPIGHGVDLFAAALPGGADPGDLIVSPDQAAVLRAALSHQARPLVQAVIDIRLDRLTGRHPDLLHHIEGRITAARALADLLTDLPAGQILTLATYIAERTGTGIDTVANAVITNLERAPGKPVPPTPAQPAKDPPPRPGEPDAGPAGPRPRRGRSFPPPGTRSTRPTQSHPVPGITRPRRTR